MRFFIDIQHTMEEKRTLFFPQKGFSIKIRSVAIMSEDGSLCVIKNKSINAIQERLLRFIEDAREIASRQQEKTQFIVYRDPITVDFITDRLLGHTMEFQIWDMYSDLIELAAFLPNDHFSIESDYTLYIERHPSADYTLDEKVQMICSHVTFPDWQSNEPESICKWMYDAYENYKLLMMHLYKRGFHAMFNNSFRNGNK